MVLKVYNTLLRGKEEFKPISGNRVFMFVCGPTTYDHSHLGHARTYVAFDMIARYLRYKGYDLFYLMNVTDIDDNIINRANELNIPPNELAEKFFQLFLKDMETLRISSVNLYAKASEHVPEIIAQAQTLIEKGFAYHENGKVYYEIEKFKDFGKLSGQNLDALQAGARVDIDEDKRNPLDFILWKKKKPGEPEWDSPWGAGRPGWHIEDTAITTKYFGEQYDIHGGARDLIFPHHESEITIAESATGKKPFVKYWFHTGFLNIEGEKMSKSLGNFLTIQDVLNKYKAEIVRFFLLYTHYRSPIDFAEKYLAEAEIGYKRLENSYQQLLTVLKNAPEKTSEKLTKPETELLNKIKTYREKFIKAMDDDFNTREAIAVLFEISHIINKTIPPGIRNDLISKNTLNQIREIFLNLTNILGLFDEVIDTKLTGKEKEVTGDVIELLIEIRDKLRTEKNFQLSDLIRDKLKTIGVILEDSKSGTTWKIER